MPSENIGKEYKLVEHQIALVLKKDASETLRFEIMDGLDYADEEDRFVACFARGMIEFGIKNPEMLVSLGAQGFVEDGLFVEKATEEVETADGQVIEFPKTVGNA